MWGSLGGAAVLVAMLLTGCDGQPSEPQANGRPSPPSASATASVVLPSTVAKPAELCTRMAARIDPSAEGRPVRVGGQLSPLYDSCEITGPQDPAGVGPLLVVDVSVLPSTAVDLQVARDHYDRVDSFAYGEAVRVDLGDGGFGPRSVDWRFKGSVRVFLAHGRLIRIRDHLVPSRPEVFRSRVAIAAAEAAHLSAPQPMAVRPECDAGTAAAGVILGSPAEARRDVFTGARLEVCSWAVRRRVVTVGWNDATSRRAETYRRVLGGATEPTPGSGVIRVGEALAVEDSDNRLLVGLPSGAVLGVEVAPYDGVVRADVIELAKALLPAFR